jgi:hypothetical protein
MASVSARSRPVMCSTPPLDHRLRRRSCWVCAGCRRLGLHQVARGAGLRTRVGSMVDTGGALSVTCFSATDLSNRSQWGANGHWPTRSACALRTF